MRRGLSALVAAGALVAWLATARVQTVNPVEFEHRNLTLHEAVVLAYSRGDVSALREVAGRVIEQDPETPAAADAKIFLALAEETPRAARDRLDALRREYPGTVWEREAYLAEARLHLLWGEPSLALVRLQAAQGVPAAPHERSRVVLDGFEIAERLISLYLSQGLYESATPLIEEYRDQTMPASVKVRFLYLEAVWRARTGRPDDAESIINDLLVRYPGADVVGDAQNLLKEIGRFDLPGTDLSNLPATLPLE